MNYNVMEDRKDWARVKAGLMTPGDRAAMLEELIVRDEHAATRIIGRLAAAQHGFRAKARRRVSYPA